MLWLILSLIGAFFHAVYHATAKKLLAKMDQHVLAAGSFLSAGVILFLISFLYGLPQVQSGFFLAVMSTSALNVIATILMYHALKTTDLSLTIPMLSFTPLFLIITAAIILGEMPTLIGIGGIILIVMGSYILNMTEDSAHLLDPFKSMIKNRAILSMLGVAFIYGISASVDKIVMRTSDIFFGSAVVCFIIGIAFAAITLFKNGWRATFRKNQQRNWRRTAVVGGIIVIIIIAINLAYTLQIVPYVIAIKRLSVLFSVILGGVLFREKNMIKRCSGAVVMMVGMLVIILSSS